MNDTTPPALLVDGSTPRTPADLLARLDALGIEHTTLTHQRVYTVEESKSIRGSASGGFSKNLFLRNKKSRMWLVTLLEDRTIDLRWLGEQVGAGRVSFASPERLMRYLGVIPGAVTPFAVINDVTGAVSMMIDQALLERDPLHFHPLDNGMTTTVSTAALLSFLDAAAHPATVVDFDRQP